MRVALQKFGDTYSGHEMRLFVRQLEQLFSMVDARMAQRKIPITGNYTVTIDDNDALLLVDTTSAGITITIPTVTQTLLDQHFRIEVVKVDSSTNVVTIQPVSGTICGNTSGSLTAQWEAWDIRAAEVTGDNYVLT